MSDFLQRVRDACLTHVETRKHVRMCIHSRCNLSIPRSTIVCCIKHHVLGPRMIHGPSSSKVTHLEHDNFAGQSQALGIIGALSLECSLDKSVAQPLSSPVGASVDRRTPVSGNWPLQDSLGRYKKCSSRMWSRHGPKAAPNSITSMSGTTVRLPSSLN